MVVGREASGSPPAGIPASKTIFRTEQDAVVPAALALKAAPVSDTKSAAGIPSSGIPTSESSGPAPFDFPMVEKPAVTRRAEWAPGSASDWTKVRKLALEQMNRFISLEPKVLKGNKPNAIHDMRVASRRLQQLLDLLYPAPPKAIRRLRRSI